MDDGTTVIPEDECKEILETTREWGPLAMMSPVSLLMLGLAAMMKRAPERRSMSPLALAGKSDVCSGKNGR